MRSQIARTYRKLQEHYGEDREGFAREWRRRARRWNFDQVNRLIADHNEWYPVEAQLPLNPRTGYRNEPGFCEALAVRIRDDVAAALELPGDRVRVTLEQKARGGITITASS